jgi:hypothetical protein
MVEVLIPAGILRRYLLGGLSGAVAAVIERGYLMVPSIFGKLEFVEDMLVDEYVRGELPEPERRMFEVNYLVSERRRSKCSAAAAAMRYANAVDIRETERAGKPRGYARRVWASAFGAALACTVVFGWYTWTHRIYQIELDSTTLKGVTANGGSGPFELPRNTRVLRIRLDASDRNTLPPGNYSVRISRDAAVVEVSETVIGEDSLAQVDVPARGLESGVYEVAITPTTQSKPLKTIMFRFELLTKQPLR